MVSITPLGVSHFLYDHFTISIVSIMDTKEKMDPTLVDLKFACSNLRALLQTSTSMEKNLANMDKRFTTLQETLITTSRTVAPLQSLAMETKALEKRINRAISPALTLIKSFQLAQSLQQKLLQISSKLPSKKNQNKRLEQLIKYVDCVDQLNDAMDSISRECEPAIQKLQEVVEFLSRTKATDQYRTHRLRETLVTLKALYETEIDAMRYEGLFDEALLSLQDEYESILLHLKHGNIGEVKVGDREESEMSASDLGSELEVEVLRRIAETLARNDCLDICIDIFVKVRYRRAAKALMRLNPDYLRTYAPAEIDEMEWEDLETAIALWTEHFELAVKTVFVSEKKLCNQVLSQVMDGVIWTECFVKIADKIMAVFFRFGEGVARSTKEPQKLFRLLDMFDSLEKLKLKFSEIFDVDAGSDICLRYRELEKLLIHAACKVFWEFGLQIEGNQDGFPPPLDGSVPKLVRYAINYLKFLATDTYVAPMGKVLQIDQIWKAGVLSKPETDENLLKNAILNVMEALERNIDLKRSRYKDKILPHIFTMNTYWYIYMRTRSTELGKLLGEQWIRKKYKTVAEEAAYMYQKQAWGPLVRLLETEESKRLNTDTIIRGKMEAFMKDFDENLLSHRSLYNIPDADLRKQIRESTIKFVLPVYDSFWSSNSDVLQVKSVLSPDSIQGLIEEVFGGSTNQAKEVRSRRRRSDSKDQSAGGNNASGEGSYEMKNFRALKDNDIDVE